MMYDIIAFGATFLSAGIAQTSENCLIIERRPQAGYEFISSFNFGTNYDEELKSEEANELKKTFEERDYKTENRISLFNISAPFYRLLEDKNVLLNTEIISVCQKVDHFVCTAHGVSGFRTFEAKKIIDTRCDDDNCNAKTFNLLMDGNVSELSSDLEYENWGFENNYVLRIPVSTDETYTQARKKAKEIIGNLPGSHRLVLSADVFDYEVKDGYPKTGNDIMYIPSKKYENPLLAFDAGIGLGKELSDATF